MELGKHVVKVVAYGIAEGKEGKADSLWVTFQNKDKNEMTWFGSFSGGGAAVTLKTLLGPLGMIAEPDQVESCLERIAIDGIDSGLINTDKELQITVEENTYMGKTRKKISWVNELGSSVKFNAIAADKVKGRFGGLNVAGTAAAIKEGLPPQSPKAPPMPQEQHGDIPF